MISSARNLARIVGEAVSEGVRRFRRSGAASGWTALNAKLTNNYFIPKANARRAPRHECPVCGWRGWSLLNVDCGSFIVPNAECPNCHCHERHRMMHLFLTRRPPAFLSGTGRVLHFAPEVMVQRFVSQNPALKYIAFDIDMSQYSVRPGANADLHHLPIADEAAVGLFCLHVLEHVRSDIESLAELNRILKPGGEAVIMVPFMMGQAETEEYPAPDPEMWDHVRGYSPLDFKHRLAPFEYEEILPRTFLSEEEVKRFAVPDSQVIYLCKATSA